MKFLEKPPTATVLSGDPNSVSEAATTLDTMTMAWRVIGVGQSVEEVAASFLCPQSEIRQALRSLGVALLTAAFDPDAAPLPLEQQ